MFYYITILLVLPVINGSRPIVKRNPENAILDDCLPQASKLPRQAQGPRGEIEPPEPLPDSKHFKQQARWPTGPRGMKGEKGEPGDATLKTCYDDDELSTDVCNSLKYSRGAKLRISPSVVNNTVCGAKISLSGPCFDAKSKITCIFHDPLKGPIYVEGFALIESDAVPTAHCIVPFMQDTGRITVDLIVNHLSGTVPVTSSYSGYLWTVMPRAEVNAAFMNCETYSDLHVSWTAGHSYIIGVETVDIGVFAFDQIRKVWLDLGLLAKGLANTGSATVDVAKFKSMIADSVLIISVRRSVEDQTRNDSPIAKLRCDGALLSSFIHRIASCEVPDFCSTWYYNDAGIPTTEQILPCPSLLAQASIDSNFFEDDSEKVKLLRHFQPDAKIFRSRFGSGSGVGQQCVYDRSSGNLIVGPSAKGSSANRRNPDGFLQKTLHFIDDVIPFMACCYGINDECDLYYERRPIANQAYIPPHVCSVWGASHFATCDFLTYTFQGVGEFWLVKSYLPDGTVFFAQVRLEKWSTNARVSIPTALAIKDGKSSPIVIRPSKTMNRLEILADGHSIPISNPSLAMQTFRGFSIVAHSSDGTVVTVAFGSGMCFQVGLLVSSGNYRRYLNIIAFVGWIHRFSLKGLLGNFDGKADNEFITPDGTHIPSYPEQQLEGNLESKANLAVVYWNFGMKWAIDGRESLFVYACGQSSADLFDASFIPSYEIPEEFLAGECSHICGQSRSCLIDCVNIDPIFANVTAYLETMHSQTVKLLLQNFVTCSTLAPPENGFLTGPYGGVANFGCDVGYTLIGPSAIQCVNGTWSENTPECKKTASPVLNCPSLVSPIGGFISGTDSVTVTFSCHQGYSIHGNVVLKCENGRWSSKPPVCIDVTELVNPIFPKRPPTIDSSATAKSSGIVKKILTLIGTTATEELTPNVDIQFNVNFNLPESSRVLKPLLASRNRQ